MESESVLSQDFDDSESNKMISFMNSVIVAKGYKFKTIDDVVKFQKDYSLDWDTLFKQFKVDRKWITL
jgi:hypothetical protein